MRRFLSITIFSFAVALAATCTTEAAPRGRLLGGCASGQCTPQVVQVQQVQSQTVPQQQETPVVQPVQPQGLAGSTCVPARRKILIRRR